jgi:hypothetical protein
MKRDDVVSVAALATGDVGLNHPADMEVMWKTKM